MKLKSKQFKVPVIKSLNEVCNLAGKYARQQTIQSLEFTRICSFVHDRVDELQEKQISLILDFDTSKSVNNQLYYIKEIQKSIKALKEILVLLTKASKKYINK